MELRAHPWSVYNVADENSAVDARGSARVVLSQIKGQLRLGNSILPPVGFPFLRNGKWQQAYHLPFNSSPGDSLQKNSEYLVTRRVVVEQTNLLPRPRRGKSAEEDLESIKHRDQWLKWQLYRYFELGHPTGVLEGLEAVCGSLVRREWKTIRKEWINKDADDTAISLIVRLATRYDLLHALDLVTSHPRRILERYRDNTPISRIQELDSTCIRSYAQRSGRTTLEKAGSKQQLLSILRRENLDTLENRVTVWVLQRMRVMANAWLGKIKDFALSERSKNVSQLAGLIAVCLGREACANISEVFQLPIEPNYPLQFEPRYKLIWSAYLEILSEDDILEDTWTWQRSVWCESGRQIFHGFLTEHWHETAMSTQMYRSEGLGGQWVLPFRAPGPFENGICLYDALDISSAGWSEQWKETDAFVDSDRIGSCGCEEVIWFANQERGVAIWYALLDPEVITLEEMVRYANASLSEAVAERKHWVGLVIAADLSLKDNATQVEEARNEGGRCIGVSIPTEAHRHFNDIRAGFELALEAAGGKP